MPISFHDDETIEEMGLTAFLHLEAEGDAMFGCLLFLNARGEPLEFVYNRLELMNEVLWRPADRMQAAQRRLSATLFRAATLSPAFLLVRAADIAPQLFGPGGQIALEIPVGRVTVATEPLVAAPDEVLVDIETFNADGEMCATRVFWSPQSPMGPLFQCLVERGLVLEPFSRAAAGLHAVYSEALGEG